MSILSVYICLTEKKARNKQKELVNFYQQQQL